MALKNNQREGKFVSILADGKMHMTVPEGTEGAVKRDYETSDGKKGTKHELVYTELSGMIEKIEFYEGDFGKSSQSRSSRRRILLRTIGRHTSSIPASGS